MKSLLTPDFKQYSEGGLEWAAYIRVIVKPFIKDLVDEGYSRAEIGHIILTEVSAILRGDNE